MRRLILWDIDGTLVSTGRVGRMALEEGARLAAGLDELPDVVMSGKTDPQIVAELLAGAGIGGAEARRLLPAALAEAERLLAAESETMARDGFVHPGVPEALAALAAFPGVRQALLTGNTEANAALKVRTFGLDRWFDFGIGAYGTDHADRDRLVPVALGRARELRGEEYGSGEVWVIGDTARDLSCAKAASAMCLIVGTGHEGFSAVAGLEADALVEDLGDTEMVVKLLLGEA